MQASTVVHESKLGTLTRRSAARDDEESSHAPMFRSLEAALSFAFTWRARPGVKAATYDEFTGADGSALLLSVGEKKTQAQYVHDVIESHLTLDQRALLDATYGGERGERHAGAERLVCLFEHVNRSRALIRWALMREFIYGERYCPTQQQVARECGVNQATVSRVAAQIAPKIAELRKAAHDKLRPAFERRGWIERQPEISQ